ncbi:MAG: HD domain-containing phosphohydrolase [Dehalococcoidia bacterium]
MMSTQLLRNANMIRATECLLALGATLVIGALVIIDGAIPSTFTSLFFIPILVIAYRHPLPFSLVIAGMASLFSSPAMGVVGVEVRESIRPVLWLGWPAVYLFLAVSLNEWASIRQQRQNLDTMQESLLEVQDRNERREQELQTLSSIHVTILSGGNEGNVINEITRQVAQVTGAKICSIVVPSSNNNGRPLISDTFTRELFNRTYPESAPRGEGVVGWAIQHRRIAASGNIFLDPRYDQLRELATAAGFASAAAAPIEMDRDTFGALVISYAEERTFSPEELTRLERLARQAELAIRSVRQRESLSHLAFDTALVLSEAIESRDPYTGGHCRRLADKAIGIARTLALPNREIETIRLGAALHDMGKIVVPDSVLKKPGKLTPEEYAIVKQHCYSGGQLCKRVSFLMDAYPVVYYHHERWDGKGYPDGLKGDGIPLGARIVAVVDAHDAMTNDRPYRDALDQAEAIAILKDGAGSQWDPDIVLAFLRSMENEPDSTSANTVPAVTQGVNGA